MKKDRNGTSIIVLSVACFSSIVMLASGVSSAQISDPGAPGPFAVTRDEYDFGDTAFTPPGAVSPIELRGSVTYPQDLSAGPFPLVVILHGVHSTCYSSNVATLNWPCPSSLLPIPSYRGYDYLAERLASHGFIVVSISANGAVVGDAGESGRAELIHKHLELWSQFNTTGGEPFGTRFQGHVDMTRIGLAGHSAGGAGVAKYPEVSIAHGSPFPVKAMFLIAPADQSRPSITNIPFTVLLSYCDGETGMIGVHYYDDARYSAVGDTAGKHQVLVMGANHDFYNSVWTPGLFQAAAIDDGASCNAPRITDAQQRAVCTTYFVTFFRVYLAGESQFMPILTGAAPPPPSAGVTDVFVSYHPPDDRDLRLDVNRLESESDLTTNRLGGEVIRTLLKGYGLCGGESPEPEHCLSGDPRFKEPHTLNPTAKRGLSQLQIAWKKRSATYSTTLPLGSGDVSRFEALQFRAGVNFEDSRNGSGNAQDFSVELEDGAGVASSVRVSDVSGALYFPPGDGSRFPVVSLNAVRIPLSAFKNISLNHVRTIRFKFDQKKKGALLLSDIAFVATPRLPGPQATRKP